MGLSNSAAVVIVAAALGLPAFIGLRTSEIPDLQADLALYRQTWREAGHAGEPSVYLRIPVYTIIIAVWVSVIDMTLAAFVPALYAQVGLYIKLIVAFAIIISRLEVFASRQPIIPTFWDAVGMGLGFLLALVVIGAFREVLGNGSILGFRLVPVKPLLFFALPAGGFFSIALLMAFMNRLERQVTGKAPSASGGGHA